MQDDVLSLPKNLDDYSVYENDLNRLSFRETAMEHFNFRKNETEALLV